MPTFLKKFKVSSQKEGVGATVKRIIGTSNLRSLDPFLMCDNFNLKLPAGFPDHPHRGFETVTYMLQGSIYHEDCHGHSGKIEAGDIQWMTAGRGIVHSEMPGTYDIETKGFQVWINLPAKKKMCDPKYQEFRSKDIPEYKEDGLTVKVIAGDSYGLKAIIKPASTAMYLDVHLELGKIFKQKVEKGWNALVFTYLGEN